MTYTLAQLEAFVCSEHYDPEIASLIAQGIPVLPSYKGEQISPGVTRIRGNLCNVHGRYGRCPGSPVAVAKPKLGKRGARKPRKGAKPKVDRAAEQAKNRAATLTSAGYSAEDQAALGALRSGEQPAKISQALVDKGLVEQASDGSYRMTGAGRALLSAADQGDAGRTRDTASSSADRLSARRARQEAGRKRQQDSAGKRAAAQMGRELTRRERADAAAKKRAAAQANKKPSGGSKKPAKEAIEKPRRDPATTPRMSRMPMSTGGGGSSGDTPAKKPPKAPKATRAQQRRDNHAGVRQAMADADQGLSPSGFDSLIALSGGTEPDAQMAAGLVEYGMAERGADGTLRLTSAARSAIAASNRGDAKAAIDAVSRGYERAHRKRKKDYSFRVFKDASGRHRWVAQSSTAFQDRDKEIVSTKALADDCAFADKHQSYGPLRWWHSPGLDLGDCDFNAMHGRVLIESGTFRSAAIAQKVAAADGLEISLGFLHLPTEPDANGVFHHIRRFERSLVPRGKASNRFTAFAVKETRMDTDKISDIKIAGLKAIGFNDDQIQDILSRADTTMKAADGEGIAFKSDEPIALPDVIINGVTYKAFPPKADEEPVAAVVEEDAFGEEPVADEAEAGGLTLSPEDIAAIGSAVAEQIGPAIAQVMGALDLEKKVAGHVQGLLAPYQATKDAEQAQAKEQIETLTAKVDELTGSQAAVPYRASTAKDTVLTDVALLAAAKAAADPDSADPWADIKRGLGLAQSQ